MDSNSRKRSAPSSSESPRRLRQCFFTGAIGSCTPSTTEYYRLTSPSDSQLGQSFSDALNRTGLMQDFVEAQNRGEELWACHAHFVWSWTEPGWRDAVCGHLFEDWGG
ncbi:hypothetical protein SpCBS45565_g02511 [Spizellomyces sp. 'palustris']|nr:hypothetical protein SpCBS45565_g02511 [Spizellomyces sp. 'palustris']